MFRSVLVSLLLVFAAHTASAKWEDVRELVRSADKTPDKEKQLELLEVAYALGQEGVKQFPSVSNEWLWCANAAGRLGQISATRRKIDLSKVVKAYAEKAIQLDPKNGPAYMTLGAWHFYVSDLNFLEKNIARLLYGGLPKSSYEDAVSNLTKALEYGAENLVEVYYIRGFAHAELGMDREANADFKNCLSFPARNEKERKMQKKVKERLD